MFVVKGNKEATGEEFYGGNEKTRQSWRAWWEYKMVPSIIEYRGEKWLSYYVRIHTLRYEATEEV